MSEIIASEKDRYQVVGPLTYDTVLSYIDFPQQWLSGQDNLTVNLEKVTKTDSAGVALLLEWMQKARALDRKIIFLDVPAKLHDLIRVNGLSSLFPD